MELALVVSFFTWIPTGSDCRDALRSQGLGKEYTPADQPIQGVQWAGIVTPSSCWWQGALVDLVVSAGVIFGAGTVHKGVAVKGWPGFSGTDSDTLFQYRRLKANVSAVGAQEIEMPAKRAYISHYRWGKHCRVLFQPPVAAEIANSPWTGWSAIALGYDQYL